MVKYFEYCPKKKSPPSEAHEFFSKVLEEFNKNGQPVACFNHAVENRWFGEMVLINPTTNLVELTAVFQAGFVKSFQPLDYWEGGKKVNIHRRGTDYRTFFRRNVLNPDVTFSKKYRDGMQEGKEAA